MSVLEQKGTHATSRTKVTCLPTFPFTYSPGDPHVATRRRIGPIWRQRGEGEARYLAPISGVEVDELGVLGTRDHQPRQDTRGDVGRLL